MRRLLAVSATALAVAACGADPSRAPSRSVTTVGTAITDPAASGTAEPAPAATPAGRGTTGRQPEGFDRVAADVTRADGSTCRLCLWLADDADERRRGLMGVTDLAGADGMLFHYDIPSTSRFWMRDTPMPLSIAFFAPDGALLSTSDMEPCLDGPAAACPRYPPGGAFTDAVEVPQGRLTELGIGPGARLVDIAAVDGCPP